MNRKYLDETNRVLNPFDRTVEPAAGDRGWAVFGEAKRIDADAHAVDARFSSPQIDRYGEIVDPMGCREFLPRFRDNPQLLKDHDHGKTVGAVERVDVSAEGLDGRAVFETDPDVPAGREQWALYRNRRRRAFSIGFIAHEWEMRDVPHPSGIRRVRVFTVWELLEVSCVGVPANQEALARAIKAIAGADDGGGDPGDAEFAERVRALAPSIVDQIVKRFSEQRDAALLDLMLKRASDPDGPVMRGFEELLQRVADRGGLDAYFKDDAPPHDQDAGDKAWDELKDGLRRALG